METENPKKPENNPQLSETEAYFNSLLKSQQEEQSGNNSNKFRPFTLLVLVLVIGGGLYYAVNFYIKATEVIPTTGQSTEVTQNSGAYFTPEYYSNRDRKITGKINRNFNNTTDENQAFQLEDQDGKTVAYLYSETNDLSLSSGLTVEINGRLRSTAPDGKEIIEVLSIRLK